MKILCGGDLHIGRRSTKIPEDFEGKRFSSSAVWDSMVQLASDEGVDLVLLSGDVVDRDNRFFEAFGPLERGIDALGRAGIQTCAVAGNHDFDVLGRLADQLGSPSFHLLGRRGEWEREKITLRDGSTLHVDGWSFPAEHVTTSPLVSYPFSRVAGPVLGLLHADLDQPESRYAPVRLEELRNKPVSAWILGHVHKPTWIPPKGGPSVLYPGSPQAMNMGETGPHGPWIFEIDSGEVREPTLVPLSTVRYDTIRIDLDGVETVEGLERAIVETARVHRDSLRSVESLALACCSLELVGRTRLHRRLHGDLRDFVTELDPSSPDLSVRIEAVSIQTRPMVDLGDLARGNDPPAILARLLLALEEGEDTPEAWSLIRRVTGCSEQIHRSKPYRAIAEDPEPHADRARGQLLRQGWLLLDALMAQKESA